MANIQPPPYLHRLLHGPPDKAARFQVIEKRLSEIHSRLQQECGLDLAGDSAAFLPVVTDAYKYEKLGADEKAKWFKGSQFTMGAGFISFYTYHTRMASLNDDSKRVESKAAVKEMGIHFYSVERARISSEYAALQKLKPVTPGEYFHTVRLLDEERVRLVREKETLIYDCYSVPLAPPQQPTSEELLKALATPAKVVPESKSLSAAKTVSRKRTWVPGRDLEGIKEIEERRANEKKSKLQQDSDESKQERADKEKRVLKFFAETQRQGAGNYALSLTSTRSLTRLCLQILPQPRLPRPSTTRGRTRTSWRSRTTTFSSRSCRRMGRFFPECFVNKVLFPQSVFAWGRWVKRESTLARFV